MPGVVSVGVGRDQAGKPLVVGLDQPKPRTMARLPRTLEGYDVRVEIIGQIKAP